MLIPTGSHQPYRPAFYCCQFHIYGKLELEAQKISSKLETEQASVIWWTQCDMYDSNDGLTFSGEKNSE